MGQTVQGLRAGGGLELLFQGDGMAVGRGGAGPGLGGHRHLRAASRRTDCGFLGGSQGPGQKELYQSRHTTMLSGQFF